MQVVDSNRKTNAGQPHRPQAVALLSHFGISLRGIGRQLDVDQKTVCAALDTEKFQRLPHRRLHPIRKRVEALLKAAGWQGNPAALWAEYDRRLDERDAA